MVRGLEMRVPLGGGIRGNHEFQASKLIADQMRLQLAGIETQLSNALSVSLKKIKTARANSSEYQTMIKFNEDLLKTERDRLNVGKIEGRRVLEVEAGLYEVKQGLAEALVAAERAALELQLAEGSVLRRRGMDFTPEELRDHTLALIAKRAHKPLPKADVKKATETAQPPKFRFTPSSIRLPEPEPEPGNSASEWLQATKAWAQEFLSKPNAWWKTEPAE